MSNNNTFSIKYNWGDFHNSWRLTDFQRHRIKKHYRKCVKEAIQGIIDESIRDKTARRSELNAHNDPNNPFRLDIGGEG
jgi:hypothetical protein